MTENNELSGCTCDKCIDCCNTSPGWFGSIEEVIGAANMMNMPIRVFMYEYLIREWYYAEVIEVPAPRKNFDKCNGCIWQDEMNKNKKGFVRASWGHNLITGFPCIFLTENNRCSIYESRPLECKISYGCRDTNKNMRQEIEDYWKHNQDWIMCIMNKEPER